MTKEAAKRGEYKPTSIDAMKAKADILIVGHSDKYEISVRNGIEIKGRGVERYSNGVYAVTEAMMRKLEKTYKVECDF